MSNRTDWRELVDEINDHLNGPESNTTGEFTDRMVVELHNAFVAGQENYHRNIVVMIEGLEEAMRTTHKSPDEAFASARATAPDHHAKQIVDEAQELWNMFAEIFR